MLVLGLSGHFSGQDSDLAPNMDKFFDDAFHDAAACLVQDGELVAAVEEERFNRIKKTTKFPVNAIRACLATAGVQSCEIDAVGHFFGEELLDRSLDAIYARNPQVRPHGARELLAQKLADAIGLDIPDAHLIFVEHHFAHGLSSYLRSGMREALVVVMDGRGEHHSITVYLGSKGQLQSLATYGLGQSLGGLYLANTRLLGYGLGDEYKVMGLAPYGNADTFRNLFKSIYELKSDGDFVLHRFAPRGFPTRKKGDDFTQEHCDFAAALQEALETIAMHVLSHWAERTGLVNLCFVGGVAHNSTLNGRILTSNTFEEVFVHPVSNDAGAAEGAALAAGIRLGASPMTRSRMHTASFGPGLGTAAEVEAELAAWGDLIDCDRPTDIVDAAAALLSDGAVLGWAQGRSEYGPRALGNRSILADPRPRGNMQRINNMIKMREAYRPFAPVVTPEAVGDYFDLPSTAANYDFMSFVVNVLPGRRAELGAVTHVDGSARIQIVDPRTNWRYYSLVRKFGELTGTPVLLNTSFNNNCEPIVQTTQDAVTCFLTTDLDFLVIDDFLVQRRPSVQFALDGLAPRFRPVTRLNKRVRQSATGRREVTCEIALDYQGGSVKTISTDLFALLEPADGTRTVRSLAGAGGISQAVRHELYALWQRRFVLLRPVPNRRNSELRPVG